MKAARLYEYGKPLQIDTIPVPEISGEETLIKVAACYVCTSDLGLLKGKMKPGNLPMTPGHNITGYIEKTGPKVTGYQIGDAVAVYGAWGCGSCRLCRQGDEQLCDSKKWVGFGVDGGYAEYLKVPSLRHLMKIDQLNPIEVAPILDAGLTAYRAIKKGLLYLYPGSAIEVIGTGNIGYYAIQLAKVLCLGTSVIAVDISTDRLKLATGLGADYTFLATEDAVEQIKKKTHNIDINVVIDTVASTETLKIATGTANKKSTIVLVGLAGGIIPRLPSECALTNSVWGTYSEQEEIISLYAGGKIKCQVKTFPLEKINDVLNLMLNKQIADQAVITP